MDNKAKIKELIEKVKANDISMLEFVKIIINENLVTIDEIIIEKQEYTLKYTTINTPIYLHHKDLRINYDYYMAHTEEINSVVQKLFLKSNDKHRNIWFPITDEIFTYIINHPNNNYTITNNNLTPQQIKTIKDNHIECTLENEKISTNKAIGYHTYQEIQETKEISFFDIDFTEEEINNFSLINDNAKIEFSLFANQQNEDEYYKTILKIIEVLKKTNKHYKITLDVENREIFSKYPITNNPNIEISISNQNQTYTLQEYYQEEEILNNLVKDIKKANLSPLEKFLAIYNITKKYKEYKEAENPELSRYSKYFLHNEYTVCAGFANLLILLAKRVGLSVTGIGLSVDTSYDDDKDEMSEKITDSAGHERVLVNMDDDKYKVHGLFISDPTWDNYLDEDYTTYALFPIEKDAISKRYVWLNDQQLILDVHNFQEFNEHINYLFKKQYKKEKDIIETYKIIIQHIKLVFQGLNDTNFDNIVNKYTNKKLTEQDYINLLTEIGHYIVSRTNQEIGISQIIEANLNSKLHSFSKKELKELKELRKELIEKSKKRERTAFPYYINSDNQVENREHKNK